MYKILWYVKGQDRDTAIINEGQPMNFSEKEMRQMVADLNQENPEIHHFFQWVNPNSQTL